MYRRLRGETTTTWTGIVQVGSKPGWDDFLLPRALLEPRLPQLVFVDDVPGPWAGPPPEIPEGFTFLWWIPNRQGYSMYPTHPLTEGWA